VIVRTDPRQLFAELLRNGDEIALYPLPAQHTPSEVCDCPRPEGRKRWHCAARWEFAKSAEFVEHNPASLLWAMVLEEPTLDTSKPNAGWFGMPRMKVVCVPVMNGRLGAPFRMFADKRMQLVIRERVRVTEGQPETAGITDDKPLGYKCTIIEQHPAHAWIDQKHTGGGVAYWCNGDGHPAMLKPPALSVVGGNAKRDVGETTQVLPSAQVPVGVQVVPRGGTEPHYLNSHRESSEIDFKSQRDSEV
jgi:hypothetical protein